MAKTAAKTKVRVRLDPYRAVGDALTAAAERACNRHDKYSDKPLSDSSRATLINEFENSFWLAIDDANLEFTR